MNKYIFWSVLMSAIFFNALHCFSDIYYVIRKKDICEAVIELDKLGCKVNEIKDLGELAPGHYPISFPNR